MASTADLLGFSTTLTIRDKGCLLTSTTNVLNHFGITVDPREANRILRQEPFVVTLEGDFVFDGPEFEAGGPVSISTAGFTGANLEPAGVQAFASTQALSLTNFAVDINQGFDPHIPTPPTQPNVNDESISPFIDFFTCNAAPIITRVANCSGTTLTCSGHFLVSREKSLVTLPGETVKNVTYSINDPGAVKNPPTDLIGQFGTRTRVNRVYGVRAWSEASSTGASPTALTLVVQSPVHVVVTDPAGRRVGLDPTTGIGYEEIFNAYYVDDTFSDPDGQAVVSEAKVLQIGAPDNAFGAVVDIGDGVIDGMYSIELVGTAAGSFTLTITNTDVAGRGMKRIVRGQVTSGARETITVERYAAPGNPFTVRVP